MKGSLQGWTPCGLRDESHENPEIWEGKCQRGTGNKGQWQAERLSGGGRSRPWRHDDGLSPGVPS